MASIRTLWRSLVLCVVVVACALQLPQAHAQASDPTVLQHAFTAAAQEFDVPPRVLLALSYNLSRWETHTGEPSTTGGFGPMHLIDTALLLPTDWRGQGRPPTTRAADIAAHQPTLQAAATLLGVSVDVLKHDPKQNIRGGAALLAQYARTGDGKLPSNEGDWYGAVVRYGGDPATASAHTFADDVFATLASGAANTTTEGQQIALAPGAVEPNRAAAPSATTQAVSTADCPADLACRVAPAAYQHNDPPIQKPTAIIAWLIASATATIFATS